MTRRLPWGRDAGVASTPTKNEDDEAGTIPSSARSAPQTASLQTLAPTASRAQTPRQTSRPASEKKSPASNRALEYQPGRSPSTSPPPEPIPESFMIEGLDNDDKYRMVEDEFAVIASQFTAHLHRTEYLRQKAQARSSLSTDAMESISRPVVGSLTELARKRQEDMLRRKRQRKAITTARAQAGLSGEGSGSASGAGDEAGPARASALQGLMNSSSKDETIPLMRLVKTTPGRAASGSGRDGTGRMDPPSSSAASRLPSRALTSDRMSIRPQTPSYPQARSRLSDHRLSDQNEKNEQGGDFDLDDLGIDLGRGSPSLVSQHATESRPARKPSTPLPSRPSPAATPLTAQSTSLASRVNGDRRHSSLRSEPKGIATSLKDPLTPSRTDEIPTAISSDEDDIFTSFKSRRQKERDKRKGKGKEKEARQPHRRLFDGDREKTDNTAENKAVMPSFL